MNPLAGLVILTSGAESQLNRSVAARKVHTL